MAGYFFEEINRTLLCSDLFHQNGDVEPTTEEDVIERAKQTLVEYQTGLLAYYMPYTPQTEGILQRLADLKPTRAYPPRSVSHPLTAHPSDKMFFSPFLTKIEENIERKVKDN